MVTLTAAQRALIADHRHPVQPGIDAAGPRPCRPVRAGSPQRSPRPRARSGRDQWLGVVGDCQSLINTLTAVQDAAIAEAARRESVWCEDGTLGETVHAPGRVSLDAADLVAPVIGASHHQAQRRVEQAVRLAAGRVPVPAERPRPARGERAGWAARGDGGRAARRLPGRGHRVRARGGAGRRGRRDRDRTVRAPRRRRRHPAAAHPGAARTHLPRPGARTRQEARAATGLRRWVAEPGVDEWHGTFPSEDAATAWAAIDKPRPRPGRRRHLHQHRTSPRQGPDRPGHRQRHHRRPDRAHRPRRHRKRPHQSRRRAATPARLVRPDHRTDQDSPPAPNTAVPVATAHRGASQRGCP